MKTLFKQLLRTLLPQSVINHLYHLPRAFIASRMYGNPSSGLEIIGVTGTDGKTTTTSLIYHILKTAKKKVAMISTVEVKIGRKSFDTGLHVTSPDPFALQKFLRMMRSQKIRYVVLEATSHGLDQFRLFPIVPKIAVLTNITHEHLDYHGSFKNYMQAKLRLFRHATYAVINKDLPIFKEINQSLKKVNFSTYSLRADSQLRPEKVEYHPDFTLFRLGNLDYKVPLTGSYNLENTLAAISAALLLDISPSDIKKALLSFPAVKGRLQAIKNNKGLHVFVDFAHTPNALAEVLNNLKSKLGKSEKLIIVFGAAGLRDSSKRPLMGESAAKYADKIIITSEDPRTEDPAQIANEILAGISKSKRKDTVIILDRLEAITYALKNASKGDWVVVAGKGHEKSMCYGTVETPWSDQEAVKTVLNKLI